MNLLLAATVALLGLAGLTAAQNTAPSSAPMAVNTNPEVDIENATTPSSDRDDDDDGRGMCVCCATSERRAVRGAFVHRGRRCTESRPISQSGEGVDNDSSTTLTIILIMAAMAILVVGAVSRNHCKTPFRAHYDDGLNISLSEDEPNHVFHVDPSSPASFAVNSNSIHGEPPARSTSFTTV